MTNAVMLSGICYILPKMGELLTKQPREVVKKTRLGCIQSQISNFHHSIIKNVIGEHKWRFFCESVVDNAWISVLATNFIMVHTNFPKAIENKIFKSIPAVFFSFCTIGWLVRRCIASQIAKRPLGRINQFIESNLGEKRWALFSKIIANNTWISLLVTILIVQKNKTPMTLESLLPIPTLFISLCTMSWITRESAAWVIRNIS